MVGLDEIVAVMIITKHLFAVSHVAWSNLRLTYESELERKVFATIPARNWIQVANEIVSTPGFAASNLYSHRVVYRDRYDDDRYDDDYGHSWGRRGYWKRRRGWY